MSTPRDLEGREARRKAAQARYRSPGWALPGLVLPVFALALLICLPAAALEPLGDPWLFATAARRHSLAADAAGTEVLAWSDGRAVFVERLQPPGGAVGHPLALSEGFDRLDDHPHVALGPHGSFVVVWQSRPDVDGQPAREVVAQRFDAGGQPVGPRLRPFQGAASAGPQVAVGPTGEITFVVADVRTFENRVWLRRYDAAGQSLGPMVRVSQEGTGFPYLYRPQLAYNRWGELLVAWVRFGCATDNCLGLRVKGRFVDPRGRFRGDEIEVTDRGAAFALAPRPDGRFVVAWAAPFPNDFLFLSPQAFAVRGRTAGPFGLGPVREIKAEVDGFLEFDGSPLALAVDPGGEVAVAWQDGPSFEGPETVFGRLLDPDLEPRGEPFRTPGTSPGGPSSRSAQPALVAEGRGQFLLAWSGDVPGIPAPGVYLQPLGGGESVCRPGAEVLCFEDGRFQLSGRYRTPSGDAGPVRFVPLGGDGAYGWLFRPGNVEMLVKFLDGGLVNGFRWLFYAGLSSVEIELTLMDLLTFERRVYADPLGALTSLADTRAFRTGEGGGNRRSMAAVPPAGEPAREPSALEAAFPEKPSLETSVPGSAAWGSPVLAAPVLGPHFPGASPRADRLPGLPPAFPAGGAGSCQPGPAVLCLLDGRFAVELRRREAAGGTAGPAAPAVPLTDTAGAFWFFRPANPEAVVKIVDGRTVNGHFWAFYGSATSLGFSVTVTDTATGEIASYEKAAGAPRSFADTHAFFDAGL